MMNQMEAKHPRLYICQWTRRSAKVCGGWQKEVSVSAFGPLLLSEATGVTTDQVGDAQPRARNQRNPVLGSQQHK